MMDSEGGIHKQLEAFGRGPVWPKSDRGGGDLSEASEGTLLLFLYKCWK